MSQSFYSLCFNYPNYIWLPVQLLPFLICSSFPSSIYLFSHIYFYQYFSFPRSSFTLRKYDVVCTWEHWQEYSFISFDFHAGSILVVKTIVDTSSRLLLRFSTIFWYLVFYWTSHTRWNLRRSCRSCFHIDTKSRIDSISSAWSKHFYFYF